MSKKYPTHRELCESFKLKKIKVIDYEPVTITARVPKVDTEGRVYYDSEKKVIDNREKFKHLRVTDFGMSNLIAVGADKNLSLVSMSSDTFTSIVNMERTISSMEKYDKEYQSPVDTLSNPIVESSNNE